MKPNKTAKTAVLAALAGINAAIAAEDAAAPPIREVSDNFPKVPSAFPVVEVASAGGSFAEFGSASSLAEVSLWVNVYQVGADKAAMDRNADTYMAAMLPLLTFDAPGISCRPAEWDFAPPVTVDQLANAPTLRVFGIRVAVMVAA